MNFISKLRINKNFVSSFSIFVFLIATTGIGLLIGRIFIDDQVLSRFLVTIFYFTTQSNFLVFIIMLLFVFRRSNFSWFKALSFIGLIDITITGLVFHIFLTSYIANINFMQQLLHTITPLLYIAFYFIVLTDQLKLKDFWIALIHPLVFVVSVYTWIHPLFGEKIQSVMTDLQGASYVYPFLDPATYDNGITGLILFNFGLLTPLIILLTLGLIFIKSKFEHSITVKNQ